MADRNYTANYMTWDMYTKYAKAVQKNNLTFEYTLATSVPVRASKSLQAIAAKSDTSEDKTGGNLMLCLLHERCGENQRLRHVQSGQGQAAELQDGQRRRAGLLRQWPRRTISKWATR